MVVNPEIETFVPQCGGAPGFPALQVGENFPLAVKARGAADEVLKGISPPGMLGQAYQFGIRRTIERACNVGDWSKLLRVLYEPFTPNLRRLFFNVSWKIRET